jgi:cytoskeletal protein CcmA (bactofilin family)
MAEREPTQIGEILALVGRGTTFRGTLAFEGRARIDGKLHGDVFGDGILVIGEGADVEGKIEVGTLIVLGGTLRGTANARQLIELHAAAKVHADLHAPEVDIAKGCLFDGRCTMAPLPGASSPGSVAAEGDRHSAPSDEPRPDEPRSEAR